MSMLVFLKECTSTNDEITRYFTLNACENFAVYTLNQKNGKGQYGNSWESSVNRNLAFSLAMPVNSFRLKNDLFNFHTAVVLGDFLAKMTKSTVEIKWPNDIIIQNKKVSGILIEKKNLGGNPYYIIGIGLNVLQTDFTSLPKAGSLLTQTGISFELHEFANALHDYLLHHLTCETSGLIILQKLNERLFKKDKVSVFLLNGMRQNGIIRNVDPEGFLWVELEKDGLKKFYHKEIELLY